MLAVFVCCLFQLGTELSVVEGQTTTTAMRQAEGDIYIGGLPKSGSKISAIGGSGFGFDVLQYVSGYGASQYTIRVLDHPARAQYMGAIRSAAQQIAQAVAIPVLVAEEPLPFDREPLPGEVLVYIGTDSPCGRLGPDQPAAGCGGPQRTTNTGRIVSGKIWIGPTFGCGGAGVGIVLHELGHAFGLDHHWPDYDGRAQVMSYSYLGTTYRSGDIRGLGALSGRNQLVSDIETTDLDPVRDETVRPPTTSLSESVRHSLLSSSAYYKAITQLRVFDSRSSQRFATGETREFTIPALAGLSATQIQAVTANVTVTGAQGSGYVTVYPGDSERPQTSNVNYVFGRDVANAAILKLGTEGRIKVFNLGAPAHVLIDVSGVFSTAFDTYSGSGFVPISPSRVIDSRTDPLTYYPNYQRNLLRAGERFPPVGCGQYRFVNPTTVIDSNVAVSGLVMNVTAVDVTGSGYVSVLDGTVQTGVEPATSTLNFVDGDTRANLAFSGAFPSIRNSDSGGGWLVADLAGYFKLRYDNAPSAGFIATEPTRVLDSRMGVGFSNRVGDVRFFPLNPPSQIERSKVVAVAINLTVTEPFAPGFLTAFPHGEPRPNASNLNFKTGETVANLAIVKVGPNMTIDFSTSAGTPNLLGDVVGYFVAP